MATLEKTFKTLYSSENFGEKEINVLLTFDGDSSSILSSKVFVVRITREDDPLFVRIARLNERTFSELKSKHRLTIQFNEFPAYFVVLLESCAKQCAPSISSPSPTENFPQLNHKCLHIVDDGNDSRLEIVAPNSKQNLVYLTLKLESASEKELQKYLCDVILALRKEKEESEILRQNLASETHKKLRESENRIELKEREWKTKEDKLLCAIRGMKSEYDKEKKSHQSEIEKLASEKVELRVSLEETNDLYAQCVNEVEKLKYEIDKLEERNEQLENRLGQLALECEEKTSDLAAFEEKYREACDKNDQLYVHCQDINDELKRNEETCGALRKDTKKGVEIIKRLQNDICQRDSALKEALNELASCQVKLKERSAKLLISTKESRLTMENLTRLEADIKDLKGEVEKLRNENKQQQDKLEESEKTTENLQSQLEKKTQIIAMLSRQMSESRTKPLTLNLGDSAAAFDSLTLKPLNYVPVLGTHR